MADNTVVQLTGFDDLATKLRAITPALRKRVIRNALAAGARLVRDEARRNAPVLAPVLTLSGAMRAPYRKPGTVKKAITVRTSKRDRRDGNIGVFINVKPAKGADKGAKSLTDPFYWQWLEFGWTPAHGPRKGKAGSQARRARRTATRSGAARQIPGRQFLRSGVKRLPDALRIFERSLGTWLDKTNATAKVTP